MASKFVLVDIPRSKKDAKLIEEEIRTALEQGSLKFVAHDEHATTGRMFVMLNLDPNGQKKTKVRVFREMDIKNLESKLNEEFSDKPFKVITTKVSPRSSAITCIVFHE